MTTPTTDALMALADRYAFHIPGSQHSDEARDALLAALQARNQQGPIKTWQERLEETCPALGPMHIHACVEEVNDAMIAEIDDLRAALQEQAREGEAALYRLQRKEGAAWIPATEWFTEPDASWEKLTSAQPSEWRINQSLTGKRVADAFSNALVPQPAQPSDIGIPITQPEQGERPASKAELLKNLTQWLDGLGLEIHTYSLRGIALHGFEKGWDAALQSAQPVALPLTVDVCFIDGDDPFICTVHGKITVDALSEIEADIHENPDFGKGDGVYSYNVTRFNGQYGFEGRCELPPGWELDEIGYEPIEAAHGIGGAL